MKSTTKGADMFTQASEFTYDVHSDEAADEFFAFLRRSGVGEARIERMKQTRADFLAAEAVKIAEAEAEAALTPEQKRERLMTDREVLRAYYRKQIRSMIRSIRRNDFYSAAVSRRGMIEFYRDRLRWIDCAPEGARFLPAPLMDKHGVPCGGSNSENVGPNQAVRKVRAERGLVPFAPFTYREAA